MLSLQVLEARAGFKPFVPRGNSKLGPKIKSFSLPAVTTCPGRSGLCEKECYANQKQSTFMFPSVKRCYARNYKKSLRKDFADILIRNLKRRRHPLVRLHVSGDFYSAEYAAKWLKIVAASPHVTFWVYTRSWVIPEILPILYQLADLPNIQVWFSKDREMPHMNLEHPNVRWAYMMVDDKDTPIGPHLYFRLPQHRETVIKQVYGTLVCPVENGVTHSTCQKCGLCFADPKIDHSKRTRRL